MSYVDTGSSKMGKSFSTSSKKSGKVSNIFGSNTNLTEIFLESDLDVSLAISSDSSAKTTTNIDATINDFTYDMLNTPKASSVFATPSIRRPDKKKSSKSKEFSFGDTSKDLSYASTSRKKRTLVHAPTPYYRKNVDVDSKLSDVSPSNSDSQETIQHETNHLSDLEKMILTAPSPIQISDSTEEVEVNGERGILANKPELSRWRGMVPLSEYKINNDPNPIVIKKKSGKEISYVQEMAIRYLRPPTPPSPGDIIIVKEKNVVPPPAPPLVIRQQPPRSSTPEPIVIREAPPKEPRVVGKKVITISGRHLPPPPRKVIIERLPPIPGKPQSIFIERWLPYPKQKRRVIYKKEEEDLVVTKPKNVIIEWDPPKVTVKTEVKYLGVVRANPDDYVKKYAKSLTKSEDLPAYVTAIETPNNMELAANAKPADAPHELVGDLQALKLIDMDKEGLSEYKKHACKKLARLERSLVKSMSSMSSSSSSQDSVVSTKSVGDLIEKIFKTIDVNNDGIINMKSVNKILLRLNTRMGKNYGEDDCKEFLATLDPSGDGTFDLPKFKSAFYKMFKHSK